MSIPSESVLPIVYKDFAVSLQCGGCGYVDRLQGAGLAGWCAACGAAICPRCKPNDERGRCATCAAENRPTRMEVAGERYAAAMVQRILNAMGDK